MSRTDSHRPARIQIAETEAAHGGRVNWHTDIKFRRYKGEGEWIGQQRNRRVVSTQQAINLEVTMFDDHEDYAPIEVIAEGPVVEDEREDEDESWSSEGPDFSDAEADADALAGIGWGTDEDYGYGWDEPAEYPF